MTCAINANSTEELGVDREEISPINLLSWLAQQDGSPRFYWTNFDRSFEVAAVGHQKIWTGSQGYTFEKAIHNMKLFLEKYQEIKPFYLLGGREFDFGCCMVDAEQKSPAFFYFLPSAVLIKENNHYYAYQFNSSKLTRKKELFWLNKHFYEDNLPLWTPISLDKRSDNPDKYIFCKQVDAVKQAIDQGFCNKIVLARCTDFKPGHYINPFSYVNQLKVQEPEGYLFLVELCKNKYFFGNSPETLLKVNGDQITSDALAGTTIRSKNYEEDKILGEKLLSSPKDRAEFNWVRNEIISHFQEIATDISYARHPGLRKLNHLQHLHTQIHARLKQDVTLDQLLQNLHPTPAVGGFPQQQALQWLRKNQTFKRGWYAAPIGVYGHDHAEYAVAIRSIYLHHKLSMYCGVGVVANSIAEHEWAELNNKMRSRLELFNGNT